MKKQKGGAREFNRSEIELIKQLREHPEMMERLQSILELTSNANGPLKTADEVEELLIREMRQLGNASMTQWAKQSEQRVAQELQGLDATVRSRKKNAEVVVCVWGGEGERKDLAQSDSELSASFTQAIGRDPTGSVSATGAGADRLWQRTFVHSGDTKCPGTLWF